MAGRAYAQGSRRRVADGGARVVIDIGADGARVEAVAWRGTPFEVVSGCVVSVEEAQRMCAALADLLGVRAGEGEAVLSGS